MTENRAELFLGYAVEKISDQPLKIAYHLYGTKATYRLCRRQDGSMFALNSRGNVCSIKGNYNFTDRKGQLQCLY